MPMQIDGQDYYGTSEICKAIGISRATLYRWIKNGLLDKSYKDRRGWRLFTEDDLNLIRAEASKVEVHYFRTRREKAPGCLKQVVPLSKHGG